MYSIRWKLLFASLITVFIPIYFLSQYAIQSFDEFTRTVQEENMANQAISLGELYKVICLTSGKEPKCNSDFAAVIDDLAISYGSELMIISPAGTVLFASSNATEIVGNDVSGRKEVYKAINGQYGATWGLNRVRNFVFYDIAVPLRDISGEIVGVSHVNQHTSQITKAIMQIGTTQHRAMIIALWSAGLVFIVIAYTLTSRLRKLTKASVDYAKGGRLLDKFTVKGKDEVAILGGAVKDMADDIDKRNRYNRDFVSTIMHEVKTPLTAIKGAAEVLSGNAGASPELRDKFLSNIIVESERLERMTGELLGLTRIDTENISVDKVRVDCCDFMCKVIDRLEPNFSSDHVSLVVDIPKTPIYIYAIEDRIEQVVANLLDNAVRYSPVDGVVTIKLFTSGDDVVVTVEDCGPGISSVNIDRVFNRFFTTESKGDLREHGSGIGLAIVKSIIESHHGLIWVESEVGKGTTFGFSLPVG